MSIDFVSEVDRKFFANNMLTTDDWDVDMEKSNLEDFTDILDAESLMAEDFTRHLNDEFQKSDLDLTIVEPVIASTIIAVENMEIFPGSYMVQLPETMAKLQDNDIIYNDRLRDNFKNQISIDGFSDDVFPDQMADDLWKDVSDSSDSGIHGVCIKQEPLSPGSSHSSESSSDGTCGLISAVTDSRVSFQTPSLMPDVSSDLGTSSLSNGSCTFSSPLAMEDTKSPFIFQTVNGVAVQTLHQGPKNIKTILNSKIKIQPKPNQSGNVQQNSLPAKTSASSTTEDRKPLVLTAEEFANLTAKGVLKFHHPNQQNKTTTVTHTVSQPSVPSSTIPPLNPIMQYDNEVKSSKRQQRMIKNRESASLSRRRRKEYVNSIESRLNDCAMQNLRLKQENETLRKKLVHLETENIKLQKAFSLSPVQKTTCLLALIMMFSLNMGSINSIFSSSSVSNVPIQPMGTHRSGRHLLSIRNQAAQEKDDIIPSWQLTNEGTLQQIKDFLEHNSHDVQSNMSNAEALSHFCPTFFNKTESMRLADQLAGWMTRHEAQKMQFDSINRKEKLKSKPKDRVVKPNIDSELDTWRWKVQRIREQQNYQIQMYQEPEFSSRNIMQAIHQRNDTFYVLSFNKDYLLVPALAHNKTMRPRMSLVIPATALNGTMQPPPGSVGMMQIDCEVLNTQFIHVAKSAIPSFENPHNSSQTPNREDNNYT